MKQIDNEKFPRFFLYMNKMVDSQVFVEHKKGHKIFSVAILLLLHLLCLVKFLLDILYFILKTVYFFIFGHSITNNQHLYHQISY